MDATPQLQLAQPLDDWCEFCENKLAVMHTADGVAACQECAEQVLESMRIYEAEQAEIGGLHFGPSRAQRRAAQRRNRKRNNGAAYGG